MVKAVVFLQCGSSQKADGKFTTPPGPAVWLQGRIFKISQEQADAFFLRPFQVSLRFVGCVVVVAIPGPSRTVLGKRLDTPADMPFEYQLLSGETGIGTRILQMETDFMTALLKKFHDVCRGERAATEKNVSPRLLFIQTLQHFLQFFKISPSANLWAVKVRTQPAEHVPMYGTFPVRPINIKTNNKSHNASRNPIE